MSTHSECRTQTKTKQTDSVLIFISCNLDSFISICFSSSGKCRMIAIEKITVPKIQGNRVSRNAFTNNICRSRSLKIMFKREVFFDVRSSENSISRHCYKFFKVQWWRALSNRVSCFQRGYKAGVFPSLCWIDWNWWGPNWTLC